MTKEEANKLLTTIKLLLVANGKIYISNDDRSKVAEAFDMATSDLSENKGDLISRQVVLDELKKWDWQDLYLPSHFKQILDDVPSVENKGEWIECHPLQPDDTAYMCSKCHSGDYGCERYDFCPWCGADMREPKGEKGTE